MGLLADTGGEITRPWDGVTGLAVLETVGDILAPDTVVLRGGVAAHCGRSDGAVCAPDDCPLMARATPKPATAATVAATPTGTADILSLGA